MDRFVRLCVGIYALGLAHAGWITAGAKSLPRKYGETSALYREGRSGARSKGCWIAAQFYNENGIAIMGSGESGWRGLYGGWRCKGERAFLGNFDSGGEFSCVAPLTPIPRFGIKGKGRKFSSIDERSEPSKGEVRLVSAQILAEGGRIPQRRI